MKRFKHFARIFWGAFFIVAALLLIFAQTSLVHIHVSIFTVIFTILIASFLMHSLFTRSIVGIIFSIAFFAILYAKPLGLANFHPGVMILTATFLSIGLSLIFRDSGWNRHGRWIVRHRHEMYQHAINPDVETIDASVDGNVKVNNRLSGSVRYIEEPNLKNITITAYMAGSKIYLDGSTIQADAANINVDIDLSGTDLYLPHTWNTVLSLSNYLGSIEEKGRSSKTGPKVYITGRVRLSSLTIHYI